jgi:hypothetical protein
MWGHGHHKRTNDGPKARIVYTRRWRTPMSWTTRRRCRCSHIGPCQDIGTKTGAHKHEATSPSQLQRSTLSALYIPTATLERTNSTCSGKYTHFPWTMYMVHTQQQQTTTHRHSCSTLAQCWHVPLCKQAHAGSTGQPEAAPQVSQPPPHLTKGTTAGATPCNNNCPLCTSQPQVPPTGGHRPAGTLPEVGCRHTSN